MGTFSVRLTVRHPVHAHQQLELEGLVGTGALFTQIPVDVLARVGITPSGTRAVHYADGTRDVVRAAKADIAIDGVETATVVLGGKPGSLVLVGAATPGDARSRRRHGPQEADPHRGADGRGPQTPQRPKTSGKAGGLRGDQALGRSHIFTLPFRKTLAMNGGWLPTQNLVIRARALTKTSPF